MKTALIKETPTWSTISTCSFWRLYLFRFLSAWGDRQWWFACGIFIFQLHPKDLTLNGYLELAQNLSKVLFGSLIGAWIDNNERMLAVKVFLVVQNVCIAAACVFLYVFFSQHVELNYNYMLLAVIVIGFSIFSELAKFGEKIVVERDWLVQICQTKDNLTWANTIFQTIDLGCKTMAPIFVGLLMLSAGYSTTAIVLAIWHVVSAVLEWTLISMIYDDYPALLKSKKKSDNRAKGWFPKLRSNLVGWKLYFAHPTRTAGLSLAFLYMTVLTFGNVLWAYSLLQCIKESILSIFVGLAAINGILGSVAFPLLQSYFGLECAGQLGLLSLLTALTACVISVFLPGSPWKLPIHQGEDPELSCPISTSIYVLLGGVVVSRFGLWLSDIAITQIQQQEVEEEIRGKIGGVQGSLNSGLDFLKCTVVLILPSASDFGYLVFASYGSILFGVLLYTSYSMQACCRHRKSYCKTTDSN